MGLDQNLVMARNKHAVESEHFWDTCVEAKDNDEFDYNQTAELWYNRKNWDLHNHMTHKYGLDNGEWVELNKEGLEDMLDFLIHNTDYWGGFSSVPALCKALYYYDTIHANGFAIFYEGDY